MTLAHGGPFGKFLLRHDRIDPGEYPEITEGRAEYPVPALTVVDLHPVVSCFPYAVTCA